MRDLDDLLAPHEGGNIRLTAHVDGRRVTTAVAQVSVEGKAYEAMGTAVKMPDDEYQASVGVRLAVGRALRDLGRQLTRESLREVGGYSQPDSPRAESARAPQEQRSPKPARTDLHRTGREAGREGPPFDERGSHGGRRQARQRSQPVDYRTQAIETQAMLKAIDKRIRSWLRERALNDPRI